MPEVKQKNNEKITMTTLASTTADEMAKIINADKGSDNDLENNQSTAINTEISWNEVNVYFQGYLYVHKNENFYTMKIPMLTV